MGMLADDLAETGNVGGRAERFLRAAERDAESGYDLVEDQQRAAFVGGCAKSFDEAGFGRYHSAVSGDRFDDDGGELIAHFGDCLSNAVDVVVWQDDGVFDEIRGHARAVGYAERGRARPGLAEQMVGVSVVCAFKFDYLVPVGESASEAYSAHGGFRAGAGQSHLLDRGYCVAYELGELHLSAGGRAKAGSAFGGLFDLVDDLGMGVAENQRAPGHAVVDEVGAEFVADMSAAGAFDEDGR